MLANHLAHSDSCLRSSAEAHPWRRGMLRRRAASMLLHPAPPESFQAIVSAMSTGQSTGMGSGGML